MVYRQRKDEKQRKKELKKKFKQEYRKNLLSPEELTNYIENIKIKCAQCRNVNSPILGTYGKIECPRCKHEIGRYSDYNYNGYRERELRFYKETTIVINNNNFTPKNVEFNAPNYIEEAYNELRLRKAKLEKNNNKFGNTNDYNSIKSRAENGSIEAQVRLGEMYFQGNGVEEDNIKALKWFSMAAANNNAFAMNRLGEMYQYGYGVKHNDEEAVKWYKKAAAKGLSDAEFRLGWMYEKGRGGLPKDINAALKYYKSAAEKGHSEAKQYLNMILLEMEFKKGLY